MAKATGDLGTFEGKKVVRAALELGNTGYGLQESMKTDPMVFHVDDEMFVVIRANTKKIRYEHEKKSDSEMVRVHMANTVTATIVDRDLVLAMVEEQEARNAVRVDAEKGQGIMDVGASDQQAVVEAGAAAGIVHDGKGREVQPRPKKAPAKKKPMAKRVAKKAPAKRGRPLKSV